MVTYELLDRPEGFLAVAHSDEVPVSSVFDGLTPLPSAPVAPRAPVAPGSTLRDERWLRAARLARLLSWVVLAWMTIEGAVGIYAAILVGLAANAAFGAWWLDPLSGLFIAFVAVKEGREAWRGESCCAPVAAGPAAGRGDGGCQDACCP